MMQVGAFDRKANVQEFLTPLAFKVLLFHDHKKNLRVSELAKQTFSLNDQ